jgi:seryl-tRNA synthetase
LWEFNVRELVFVGADQYILHQREQAVAFVCDLAAVFDLELTIERATDPFFATVAAAKKMWQQSMEAKYEIRLLIGHTADGSARSIAAGSINVHGTFFGQRFAILTDAEQPAMTACVGLGIERLVFAAFTQHGFDEQRWPAPIRTAIF